MCKSKVNKKANYVEGNSESDDQDIENVSHVFEVTNSDSNSVEISKED